MATVPVTINGRIYDLACNDGQEDHLRGLAADIARRVDDLVRSVGQAGEARLLLMAALLLADEIADANGEIERLEADRKRAPAIDEDEMTASLERLAQHIQELAARVETA